MAGILEGLDTPKWMMTPGEWSLHSEQAAESIGRNVSGAVGHALNLMGMLQNAQQQKDNLALRTQEFQLNQKVQTGTLELNRKKQELIQQAQLREQEDLKQMQDGAEQLHQGNFDWEPEKPWGSIKSAATWEKMKGGLMTATAVGQAQLRMNDDLGKMASFDPTIPAALDATAEVYGKGSKEWLEDFRSYKREMDAANEAKAAREFQMKQKAIGERTITAAEIRAQAMIDAAIARGQKMSDLDKIQARSYLREIESIDKDIAKEQERGGWKLFGGGPRSEVQKFLEGRKAELTSKLEAMKLTESSPQSNNAPPVGSVVKGYKFLGGDPANPDSWQKQ